MNKGLVGLLSMGAALAVSFLGGEAEAQSVENMRLYRTRLDVKTCDVADAGTDDNVYIRLTSSDQRFYVDKPGDDRRRNLWDSYDVILPSVLEVNDITRLGIHKSGTDGWCIKEVRLFFNESSTPVFSHVFPNGQWIDGNDGHSPSYTFSSSTLRASSKWNISSGMISMCAVPARFSHASLVDRIESMIGDVIGNANSNSHVRKLYWGGKYGSDYVELWRKDADTLEADLDLKYSLDNWTNPDVDVNALFDVSCAGGNPALRGHGLKVTADGNDILDWLTFGIQSAVVNHFNDSFEKMTEGLERSITVDAMGTCRGASVDADADINLSWNLGSLAPVAMCLAL